MRYLKLILSLSIFFCFYQSAFSQTGGYATARVFDCNRGIAMGSGYIAAKIYIVYEDGTTEDIPLLPYNEKNELENLKKINQTINKLRTKGYFLVAQYTTGEQGNLISDYTFLKQPQ